MAETKKVKVGVVGVGRGTSMMRYCECSGNAEIVAICDNWEQGLKDKLDELNDPNITGYVDYDEFLKHDMDAVVLANFATEHAPFAIKAMNAGKHVISEVLPCQTLKEAVELIETVERTGKEYLYLENYCFMPGPFEMRKRYKAGEIGEVEYAEGEYIHNCECEWFSLTQGNPEHWRNNMYSTFYCTHSIGPMIHITGLRPVKVSGFEVPYSPRACRMGKKCSVCGIEMITLENGAICRSVHGGLNSHSIWFSVYGQKGSMESTREVENNGGVEGFHIRAHKTDGEYSKEGFTAADYMPKHELSEQAAVFGHGGSDYYSMYFCMEKLLGRDHGETIDVFEALDMFLPGMFAYRSILGGGIPMDIPNLRNKEEREKWRNDTTCTDPKVAGEMLIPCYHEGNPNVPKEIYENQQRAWEANTHSGAYWRK